MNDLIPYFPLLATLIAILGWAVSHHLTVSREIKAKQRDMRMQFLLDAYRRLENVANRLENGKNKQDQFESALADIQLLGTKAQIEALMKYFDQRNSSQGVAPIKPLLEQLRLHLRKELDLETNVASIKIFRFDR